MAKQIHSAVRVPASSPPANWRAAYSSTGAIMNAATARISSMIAKTRCTLLERSEKPAMNSAGTTDEPTPMPTSPEPRAVSVVVGGAAPFMTRMPTVRKPMPTRTK